MTGTIFLEILKGTVSVMLLTLQLAMTVRAVFSWFPIEPNKFITFLNIITEPVIYPIRKLFQKMNWFQNIPLDMSFMTTFMIISILVLFLG